MIVTTPKEQRAASLLIKGHSCAYVAEVVGVAYSRVWRFRDELDIPPYDRANDPSYGRRQGIWTGLGATPPLRRTAYSNGAGGAVSTECHVKRCRFPMWPHGAAPTQEFCGDYARPGSSYCQKHHVISHMPAAPEHQRGKAPGARGHVMQSDAKRCNPLGARRTL